MNTYIVTFGQKYRHEDHPILGAVRVLPDGWVMIIAPSQSAAHAAAHHCLGTAWSFIYDLDHWTAYECGRFFPLGCLGTIHFDDLQTGLPTLTMKPEYVSKPDTNQP
jgi:hypothetical protein